MEGKIETDESYFGGQRKGKRGRGAPGKVAVFGLLKRNGQVYTVAVANTQTATLLPIIREKVKPETFAKPQNHASSLHALWGFQQK